MAINPNKAPRDWLSHVAAEAGFMLGGIGPAHLDQVNNDGLTAFLADGFEGDMDWLRQTAMRRLQPQNMWSEAKSAIVLGMNYGPDHDPMDNLLARHAGNISVYARGRDYHDVIKGKLKQIASQFAAATGHAVKVFVDTAPLMEKPLAQKAGMGWQGKHTNLVSRQAGSWLFLGIILTDALLPYDTPEVDHCGGCQKCLDICPTNAFPEPYRLDARRCISYLTIEHQGIIPVAFRPAIGNRIFGCDDCLAICPWNKFAQLAQEQKFAASPATSLPMLGSLLVLNEAEFRQQFAGTPVRRAGFVRFLRNVLVAAGNSGDAALVVLIMPFIAHDEGVLRGTAIWALRQLMPAKDWQALRDLQLPLEEDATVTQEWADKSATPV